MLKNIAKALLDKWIELLTLIVAVIALAFSWQANSIARQQVASNISIVNTWPMERHTYIDQQKIYATCTEKMRIQNRGGAPAAILGYDIFFSVGGDVGTLTPDEQGEGKVRPMVGYGEQGKQIWLLEALVLDENTTVPNDILIPVEAVPFPIEIAAFGTVDIKVTTRWVISPLFHLKRYSEEGYEPLIINYRFSMTSGEIVTAPNIICWYVQ